MDAKWWWLLGMVGPFGAMALARSILDWRASRAPRLTFASTEQVEALESNFRELMPKVFGLEYKDCFISDESSLSDFATGVEDLEHLKRRIESMYDVDFSSLPDDRLTTIVRTIAAREKM